MQAKMYLIPGLGFDEQFFRKLKFKDQSVHYLNWIEPLVGESIQQYAGRMAEGIEQSTAPVVLIGHSFGGIIAQEIAQERAVQKIILISSVKSRNEIPNQLKLLARFGLYRLFTKRLTFRSFRFWAPAHGYHTPETQTLFKEMVSRQTDTYLQWALYQIASWQGVEKLSTPIAQIHGESDKMFPIEQIQGPVIRIKEGSHVMAYDQSAAVEMAIQTILDKG